MKKNNFLAVLLAFFISTCLMAGTALAENSLKIEKEEGKIVTMEVGTDSAEIFIITTEGGTKSFKITPSIDWMTKSEQEEYYKIMKELPGKSWPTIADTWSQVRVWYINKTYPFLLKYKVLSLPKELWFTIIASVKNIQDAQNIKLKAYKQGFYPDILKSEDFPALRSGYYIVVVGVFNNKQSAIECIELAKKNGWKDAYSKKVK